MSRMKRGLFALSSTAALVWLAAVPGGCGGPPFRQFCEKFCECSGEMCAASDIDECVVEIQEIRDAAVAEGCGTLFDAALGCYAEISCSTPDACDDEEDLYEQCGSGQVTECDDEVAGINGTIEGCGSDQPLFAAGDCTADELAALQCQEGCFNNASCEALTGEDAAGKTAFDQCLMACSP